MSYLATRATVEKHGVLITLTKLIINVMFYHLTLFVVGDSSVVCWLPWKPLFKHLLASSNSSAVITCHYEWTSVGFTPLTLHILVHIMEMIRLGRVPV